jgi:NTE family protein
VYYAGDPTVEGIARLETIWRGLRRTDVFPLALLSGFMKLFSRNGHVMDSAGLGRLMARYVAHEPLEAKKLPCVVVTTDLLEGIEVRISSGPAVPALLASAAIPGIFPSVEIGGRHLIDGAVANHTPLAAAIAAGAKRVIVLPTGYSCAREAPPRRAVDRALHALNVLVAGKLVNAIYRYSRDAEILVVPPLCPLDVSPFDFSRTGDLIEKAAQQTQEWIASGVELVDGVPHQLIPHTHRDQDNPYGPRMI